MSTTPSPYGIATLPANTAVGGHTIVFDNYTIKNTSYVFDGSSWLETSRSAPPDPLTLCQDGKEVVRITRDGRIFWNGREVETDEDFRNCMIATVALCAPLTP